LRVVCCVCRVVRWREVGKGGSFVSPAKGAGSWAVPPQAVWPTVRLLGFASHGGWSQPACTHIPRIAPAVVNCMSCRVVCARVCVRRVRVCSGTGDALLLCVGFELLQVEPERCQLGVDELTALDIDQLERALVFVTRLNLNQISSIVVRVASCVCVCQAAVGRSYV
jgi:hypothetical protein